MGRYFKQILLSLILLLFVSIDVDAAEWSAVSLTNSHGFMRYQPINSSTNNYQDFNNIGTTYYFNGANNKYALFSLFWSGTVNWVQNGYYHSYLEYELGGITIDSWFSNVSISDSIVFAENKNCKYSKYDVANGIYGIKQECYFYYDGSSGSKAQNIGFNFNPLVQLSTDTFFRLVDFSLEYGGVVSDDQQVIINQNDKLIDNTNDIIENQDEIKKNQEDIKDSLTDETAPDTSGLENAAGWLPAGPVDSLITLPINLLQSLTNNLESSCTPINLPVPFVDSNLTLDCPETLLRRFDGFWAFWEAFGLIAGVWCLYKYFINLYKWVESHLSMDEKESLGKWGGT